MRIYFLYMQVNEIGVISFNSPFNNPIPSSFPLYGTRLIVPFWANIDIKGTGAVYYRQTTYFNSYDIIVAGYLIRHHLPRYKYFEVESVLIITWDTVGYHSQHTDKVGICITKLFTLRITSMKASVLFSRLRAVLIFLNLVLLEIYQH